MQKERFTAVKRKLFERLFDNLNEKQREAVFSVNGPLLILAGAGSGKTTVLVNRIGYMIRYGNAYASDYVPEGITDAEISGLENVLSHPELPKEQLEMLLDRYAVNKVKPWNILSITFTNKAANEMKTRLEKKVGEEASKIWAGTFHSICVRILRMYGERVGYAEGFTIYDSDDQKKVMLSVIKDTGADDKMFNPKAVMNYVSAAKDKLMSPDDCSREAADFRESKMAELYREYQKRLRTSNALDFDDIIMQTVILLQKDEEALAYCQNRFKYVCVDEYQDTNHAQFVLTALVSGKYGNLMVVGDDDQSIYRFRGADIENILNFDREMSDARVIKLEQNYRSTKAILDAANAIIANNKNRHGKSLWTNKDGGSPVSLRRLETQNDEAKYIVDKVLEMRKEGRSLNDFAVLYRLNALSNNIESMFARSGIPYRVLGGLRFYERKEIKDILAYLCVINNPADNVRLQRIINVPARKLGATTLSAVSELAGMYNESMFSIIQNVHLYPVLSKTAPKLTEFASLIMGLREIAKSEPLDVLIDKVLDLTGYRAMLKDSSEEDGETRLENVSELISNAVEFMATREDTSLNAFLEEVALVADIDNYDPDAEAVVLMTVHSAKGLEFPVVFLPALEEGIFPSQQSFLSDFELEEERRLAYVAVTRAKDRLFITHTHERLLYGKTQYNRPSRFLSEIPKELLDLDPSEVPQKKPIAHTPFRTEKKKPEVSSEMHRKTTLYTNTASKPSTVERFAPGDAVTHAVFGSGMIISAKPVGNADMLYEIAFDSVGTKKMMGTYAKIKRAN